MIRQLKRRRPVAAISTAIVGALCLRGLTGPQPSATTEERMASLELEEIMMMEDEARYRRSLATESPLFFDGDYEGEEDYDAAAALAAAKEPNDSESREKAPLPTYTLEDALEESDIFESMFTLIMYDPHEDNFVALYNKRHAWRPGNKKVWNAMRTLTYMLRKLFPERFTKDSPELILALGSGDFPHIQHADLSSILPHDGKAPVLTFGSVFRDPKVYTNMVAMPVPERHHLGCFVEWLEQQSVCPELRAATTSKSKDGGSLVFGKEFGLEWEQLIPQLVWRGTDFGYLQTLQPRVGRQPSLVHPDHKKFVPSTKNKRKRRIEAVEAMSKGYDSLLPRWKGVALTAQAELEAEGTPGALPWANIKFSSFLDKGSGKSSTIGAPKYEAWESVDVATGKGMSLPQLAEFRYHIDLGGGGGTTWGGTVEKLAMPGLLFHHVTPTRDYIHDQLTPWKQYIPVRADLKDLKQKFDWAETHPEEVKRISDAGTEFMRELGTPEGFETMFSEYLVEPLRRVIEAYRPVSEVHPDAASWRDILDSMEDCKVLPVVECSGLTLKNSACRDVIDIDVKTKWQKKGHYEATQ
mmetsp:Transcript_4/g.7  ORF Transcript_4/g.7 Transcript_4/m.7 type:complete len:582 (+) Transcript_4:89-1834(+)|eukprot:CAMPEP_0172575768 /NCGR_PEP_ID=MMETSP1067-20121228/137377_1 /TAXON_ID=265564 ORGANISM="Thalassiosira punctigera, Strain Tpunct2005C2" /NCGR_SAMPLE_ID=MMETSP1067 /ASSEMBLY_ACC=CAM_ASM_000444 /LENGTH=581 /DNA_ID=CAMNT_0013368421 /DNA_START=90 /DNA_END=1838 /DNA_ORIENTATION=+